MAAASLRQTKGRDDLLGSQQLRLCVQTRTLVCSSTRCNLSSLDCNSGTHYHAEKGTLGCITDIKEQFQNLVYELQL